MVAATDRANKNRSEFATRLLDILNGGTLSLMIRIGHKTHLDIISNLQQPATVEEISRTASPNERYVREWLGAMVVGRIIQYDPLNGTYFLPQEHAVVLIRRAGIDNLAVFFRYISLMGIVEDKIVECFYKGGGVPYSEYPKFQELQAEETARVFDARSIDHIIPLVDGLVDRLRSGIDVLDVGCGRDHAMNIMAKTYPNSRFVGYDLSNEAIQAAREEAEKIAREGLKNVRFETRDVTSLMNMKNMI